MEVAKLFFSSKLSYKSCHLFVRLFVCPSIHNASSILASYTGLFMCAVHTSTRKKGLVPSICAHAELFHFSGILYIFLIFSIYQWGVLRHEYRVESFYGLYSCVIMASSVVSEAKILFMKRSPFPYLDWDSLVCL